MSSNTDLCICAVNHSWNIHVTELVLQQLVIRAQGTDLSQFFYNHATVWSCIKLGVLIFLLFLQTKQVVLLGPCVRPVDPCFQSWAVLVSTFAGSP